MRNMVVWLVMALVPLAGCLTPDSTEKTDASDATDPFAGFDTGNGFYEVFPLLNDAGESAGLEPWRIAPGTGNCCENYVTTTSEGRILDFGGTYVKYSDDDGITWTTVDHSLIPYQNGEGAIVPAPGGDVVGIGWDPYSGDNVYGVKYEADTGEWSFSPTKLHTPFWDREWIVALPGPFTDSLGATHDYVTFARGGVGTKDVLLMSTNGLDYYANSLPDTAPQNEPLVLAALDAEADPERDWMQPLRQTTISPIGDGYGLQTRHALQVGAGEGSPDCHPVFGPDMVWRCLELTEAYLPDGALLMDSVGTLHVMETDRTGFTYHISHDGGRNWDQVTWTLPEDMQLLDWDFKANAALDQTIVAAHAQTTANTGQDLVFRLHGLDAVPRLVETLYVGDGKAEPGDGGVSNQGDRFDFSNIAMLPDGRVVVSMQDSRYEAEGATVSSNQGSSISPVLAIELK